MQQPVTRSYNYPCMFSIVIRLLRRLCPGPSPARVGLPVLAIPVETVPCILLLSSYAVITPAGRVTAGSLYRVT